MGLRRKDLVGSVYGRLTVVGPGPYVVGTAWWMCRCTCGTELAVRANSLNRGQKSCGCAQREALGAAHRSHGMFGSKVYRVWQSAVQRCHNPRSQAFKNYGARGIKVCERWHTFESFLADMGEPAPGLTLERKNNDGGYEPGNCRWATQREQARNRRSNVLYESEDGLMCIRDLSESSGVPYNTLRARLLRGVPISRALNPSKLSRWSSP